MKILVFILASLISQTLFAQKVNIIPLLKKIENGKIEEVQTDFRILKIKNSHHPDVIFLEAVLTEDGEKAQKLYELVYTSFPNSKFADAALFRNFSYYYALGLYKKATELKNMLAKEYPNSPYLKNTERNYPEVDEMILVDKDPYKIKNKSDIKFTIQAGAFGNAQNAEDLKRNFIAKGLKSRITSKTVGNLQLKIVDVGEFTTREKAEKFLTTLQKDFGIKGHIKDFE